MQGLDQAVRQPAIVLSRSLILKGSIFKSSDLTLTGWQASLSWPRSRCSIGIGNGRRLIENGFRHRRLPAICKLRGQYPSDSMVKHEAFAPWLAD